MKYTIQWLLVLLTVLNPIISRAALTDFDRQELAFKNWLAPYNSGFESGKAKWTASGGTFTAVTSGSNLLDGKGSFTWDASASGQTLTSQAITVPNGGFGLDCEVEILVQVPSGTATHYVRAFDGTNPIAYQSIISSTTPRWNAVTFPCPSSGTVALQFYANADEPLIAGDLGYVGRSKRVGSTQLISETTAWSPNAVSLTSGSITNATSTGTYSRNGDRAKVKTMTSFSAASAAFSGFRMSLPPGCVIDTAKVANDPSFSVSLGYASLLDSGVSHYAVSGKVSLINGDNQNVAVTWATTNYAQIAISNTAPFTFAANDTISTDFEVPCVGWTAQTTASIDAISKRGSIYFASGSATNTGSVAAFNVAGFGTNTLEGQALAPTTANDLGIRMTGAPAATYEIQATGLFYAETQPTTGTRTVCQYSLYDGTNSRGHAYAITGAAGSAAFSDGIGSLTGTFVLSSAGTINVVVRGQRVTGNGTCYAEGPVSISIKNVSQNSPAIVLANSVSSGAGNGIKMDAARIANAGSASINSQTSDMVSSVSWTSTGRVSVTLKTGYFSSSPYCFCTTYGSDRMCSNQVSSATSVSVATANAAGVSDTDFYFWCVGPR